MKVASLCMPCVLLACIQLMFGCLDDYFGENKENYLSFFVLFFCLFACANFFYLVNTLNFASSLMVKINCGS